MPAAGGLSVHLDAPTLTLLLLDALSAAALALLLWAGTAARAAGPGATDGRVHDLARLAALAAGALCLLRLLAWGVFFLELDAAVVRFAEQGVMCPYGVVELRPVLARAALWAKPLALGGWILWWAVALAERDVGEAPFLRGRLRALAPLAVLAGAELVLEVLWLAAPKESLETLCCSAARVAADAGAWTRPGTLLGLEGARAWSLWGGVKLLLFASLVLAGRRASRGAAAGPPRWILPCLLAPASVAVGFLDLAFWREVLAPRALGLEFHRCAWELSTRSFALGPAALLAALGHLVPLCLPLLAFLSRREPAGTARAAASACAVSALFQASEILAVAIHGI